MSQTSYAWTCPACGHANVAGATACGACTCPALASFKQIEVFRARHVQAGGAVLPGAATLHEPDDISPWRVVFWICWLPLSLVLGVPGYDPLSGSNRKK